MVRATRDATRLSTPYSVSGSTPAWPPGRQGTRRPRVALDVEGSAQLVGSSSEPIGVASNGRLRSASHGRTSRPEPAAAGVGGQPPRGPGRVVIDKIRPTSGALRSATRCASSPRRAPARTPSPAWPPGGPRTVRSAPVSRRLPPRRPSRCSASQEGQPAQCSGRTRRLAGHAGRPDQAAIRDPGIEVVAARRRPPSGSIARTGAQLHRHLPADVRVARAVCRGVHHLQHVLDRRRHSGCVNWRCFARSARARRRS